MEKCFKYLLIMISSFPPANWFNVYRMNNDIIHCISRLNPPQRTILQQPPPLIRPASGGPVTKPLTSSSWGTTNGSREYTTGRRTPPQSLIVWSPYIQAHPLLHNLIRELSIFYQDRYLNNETLVNFFGLGSLYVECLMVCAIRLCGVFYFILILYM